jgi:hypothetical protein
MEVALTSACLDAGSAICLRHTRYAIDHVQFVDITIKSTDIEFILLIYAKGRNVKAGVCKRNVYGNAGAVIP